MLPRLINGALAKTLLQFQPFVVPVVQAHARGDYHRVTVKDAWKIPLALSIVLLIVSGLGIENMAGMGRYFKSLKWTPLPLGVGFAVIALQQYRHTKKREEARYSGEVCVAAPWEVEAYKLLPLRHISRLWGWVNERPLPDWCRTTVLGSYTRTFGCDMTEAEQQDLQNYSSLSELFRRALKADARPVCRSALLTSPVDGTVLHAGPVDCGALHQIKGVQYSIRRFLGPNCWTGPGPMEPVDQANDPCFHKACLTDPANNELYQCVLYLAPGDYHRFHSPADWRVTFRRHFPGELFSVNPTFAAWIENLFVLNERVAYVGFWKHGFMSMTAVGATNVGSVKVYFDEQLTTNKSSWTRHRFSDKKFPQSDKNKLQFSKGDAFGEFNLGSTIVLLFEAPKGTVFNFSSMQKIKMGQQLISCKSFAASTSKKEDELLLSKGVER